MNSYYSQFDSRVTFQVHITVSSKHSQNLANPSKAILEG